MTRAKVNYLVDMLLAFLGAMSGITGIVLLLMGQGGGYHGGRNPYFVRSFLGIERHTWSDLHTWVSIALIIGVLIHIALHWKWIVCTTKLLFQSLQQPIRDKSCEI